MKKKQLVKSVKSTANMVKSLCSSFTGIPCKIDMGTGGETDILL